MLKLLWWIVLLLEAIVDFFQRDILGCGRGLSRKDLEMREAAERLFGAIISLVLVACVIGMMLCVVAIVILQIK